MKTLLADHNEYISVLNEDGKTDVLLKEGANKGNGMELQEAFEFIENSIREYQLKKYGHLL